MKKIERKKKKDDKQRKLLYIYIFFVSCYVRNFIENDQNKHRNILQKMFLSLYFVSLMNMIITFPEVK